MYIANFSTQTSLVETGQVNHLGLLDKISPSRCYDRIKMATPQLTQCITSTHPKWLICIGKPFQLEVAITRSRMHID